jgi:hypothetical protein
MFDVETNQMSATLPPKMGGGHVQHGVFYAETNNFMVTILSELAGIPEALG